MANRLVRAASIPFLIADTTITIGASVGIVTVAGNDDGAQPPLEGWLHRADLAMYRAKTRGRGRAEIFTNRTTAPKITHTRRWADDPATGRRLRAALDEGVLRLRYQPTVDLVTGEVLGVQAVIHWPQPPGPAVRPAELVPLAELTGLIGPLGEWALREACRQAAVWNTQRPAHTVGPVMTVNVSTTQLSDPEFGDLVGTVIGETALPPGRVGLEIAQPTTGTDQEELVAVLDALRESGVRLTVGGYGAGSSSLTVLRHLPLDWVKIDEELVGRVDVEPTDAVLVRLVIESAHSLGVGLRRRRGPPRPTRTARGDGMRRRARPSPRWSRRRCPPRPRGESALADRSWVTHCTPRRGRHHHLHHASDRGHRDQMRAALVVVVDAAAMRLTG